MKDSDDEKLKKLCSRFANPNGGAIQIMATPEQMEQLGEFLLKGVFGWALGIYQDENPAEFLAEPDGEDDGRVN